MARPRFDTKASMCARLDEKPEFAPLPNPHNKHYLREKAEFSFFQPRTTVRVMNGEMVSVSLYQITCSSLIRAEETDHNHFWEYKAEVSFDMTHAVPKPFLSTGEPLLAGRPDPARRHTHNPFPPGRTVRYLRRPDVIIVNDHQLRWPGRAATDHEGIPHPDNLLRVVEIKFPGDSFTRGQKEAYEQIAGGVDRFSVLDVSECEEDERRERELERASDRARNLRGMTPPLPLPRPGNKGSPAPQPQTPRPVAGQPTTAPLPAPLNQNILPLADNGARRIPAPIYGRHPIPEAVWYEKWGRTANELTDSIARALSELSLEMRTRLRQVLPWLREAGHWVIDQAAETWAWVNEKGEEMVRWTAAQLREALEALRQAADLTWEQLKSVEWGHLIIEGAKWVVITLLVVGAVVVCVLASKILVPVLSLLALLARGLLTIDRLAPA